MLALHIHGHPSRRTQTAPLRSDHAAQSVNLGTDSPSAQPGTIEPATRLPPQQISPIWAMHLIRTRAFASVQNGGSRLPWDRGA